MLETSDLPGGVVNILSGSRDHIAKYLVEHQNVDAMWYFGSQEGSKFVEHTSAGRDIIYHFHIYHTEPHLFIFIAVNVKRTWVDYGVARDWADEKQGRGEEFLYHATQVKNVWLTMGDIFAN